MDINNVGGTAEVAELLGCPKQQLHALRKRDDFPKPIRVLAATPLWDLTSIREFAQTWNRRGSKLTIHRES
jgi:predicted DNA-binding transcriptional regulator AlpA